MIRRKSNPGWFVKGGGHRKKHHRAKRRKSHGRRRPRRRRSNPHLLLANPSHASGQLNLFGPTGARIDPVLIRAIREGAAMRKKKRTHKKPRRKPRKLTRSRTRRRASVARRHGKRQYYRVYRGRGRRPKFRIYRRSNPFGNWFGMARVGVFGGLGVVAARIGGRLYTDHVGKMVGGGDPKSWRSIANEALRIIAMGALPIVVSRQVLRRLPIVTHVDAMAFEMGGLAEAGRQGIGVALKHLSPGLNAGKWGLDGLGAYDEVRDDGQQLYGRKGQQWYVIGYSNGAALAGLEEAGGFGALMERDGFGDADYTDDGDAIDVVG